MVLCSWVWKHDAVKAALFYAVILAIMYPTVVFFGYTLQPATYASYGVTDNGVYQYDGRQPIYTFNIDMASSAYYEPGINKLVGEMYRGGELPLWNPYQAGGTPLASQFSTRVFFPYQILEDMSPTWTWDFFFLGRMWVAGLFTYLFLRALKLRKSSAILGGLFYMLSGAMVWYIHKEEYVNVAMTVPVFLWSIERLVSVQRPSDFLIATASTALVLLSGNPEIAAYVLLLGGTYAIYRIITDYGFGWSAARTAAKIAGAGVLGAGLAAPLLIPFAELSSNAFHMHPAGGTMGTVDPAPLSWGLGVIFPTFFDTPTPQRWYPINGVWEFIGGYIGVLAVFLAVMGLLRKSPHRGLIVFFFVFGICVVLKNIGVPPFLWIGRLPLLDQVWSNRWAGPAWTFSLAIAGALGFEILQQRWGESSQKWSWRRYWGVFLGAGGLAGVLIAVVFLKPVWNAYQAMIPERHYLMVPYSRDYMEASLIGAVLSAMVVLLTAVLLWRAAVSKRYLKLGMVALAVTALWFYIPRGYDYHFLYLKLIPMLGGIAAVWMLARARWRWAIATMVIMVILATGLDLGSPHGFPKRQDPFRA
ncbi:MAG: YfhO family protein, partial [Chloroflexi bacterium]|nr:YfhO family protein [Chloroflexota bacterium]